MGEPQKIDTEGHQIIESPAIVPETRLAERVKEAEAGVRRILIGLAVFVLAVGTLSALSLGAIVFGIVKLVT